MSRDRNGRFGTGNTFGTGRPPRAMEKQYLAVLGDACSLTQWREICERAIADAKAGDQQARAWLTRYLLGEKPPSLTQLAADESGGLPVYQDAINALAQRLNEQRQHVMFDVNEEHRRAAEIIQVAAARATNGNDP